ncbi:hypothetical protein DNTS_030075 [Danionella cerebrum]|uniref:Interleukin-26 n=1 Tax=Danionella cerebrum TaxID=2873325 RepID=A0A553QSR7_9TELE|nr:hypothetical protein DNTS_030075 [Danionella translucida]
MRTGLLLVLCALLSFCKGDDHEKCLNDRMSILLKDLINTSKDIEKKLPSDIEAFNRMIHISKKCYRKATVSDFKQILDLYKESVFNQLLKIKPLLLPDRFLTFFHRLLDDLDLCESKSKTKCMEKNLKHLQEKFKKLTLEKQIKALSEFRGVLIKFPLILARKRARN